MNAQGSEVVRLLRQIELEYQAAHHALYGLSAGNSKHEFITKKMERMGILHQELKTLVGVDEATPLFTAVLEDA